MPQLAVRIGTFLREVEAVFPDDKPISFDPVQMTVLQKLVRPKMLSAGVTVAKEDYFRSIVCLDYFTEVVTGRATVLTDIGVIVEELERMQDYLDPNLVLLVRYCGLFVNKDLNGQRFFRKATLRNLRRRHDSTNATLTWPDPAPDLDVFHLAAGRMVSDFVTDERVRTALSGFMGRNDLRAGVFIDALLETLPDEEVGEASLTALQSGDLVDVAVALLQDLASSCEGWSLREYVRRLADRTQVSEA